MRHLGWAIQLATYLQAAIERPFLWGEFDCCLFAADCCVAVCGVDPAERYRGQYDSKQTATKALKRTHGSLEAAWDACFSRIDAAYMSRGDVALYDGPDGRSVGVCWAGEVWSTGEHGLVRAECVPLIVWRVE